MNEESIAFSVKRRRLTLNDCKTVQYASKKRTYKRKKRILHLPDELLYYIFSKLSIIDVATIIPAVCKRFELVAIGMMNIKFCNIHNQIERLRANRIENVTSKQCERNVIFTYKMLSILDIVHDQYKMIKASTWRYTFFQLAPRENYLAIRAGLLIDQFELLFKYLNESEILLNFMTELPHAITILKDLAKEYLDKFEKYICCTSQNTPETCGCKIVDLLDCFNGIERKVVTERCENNVCNLSITYTLERAWFTVLNLGHNGEDELHDEKICEDMRFMYKRLRRLVRAHNSIYFEEAISYQKNSPFTIDDSVNPNFAMYCGYGEMCDKFYFYGTMTEAYMVQRLARGMNIRVDNNDNDDEDINENPFFVDIERDNTILIPPHQITKPILTFEVSVKCPMYMAPWCVLKKYNTNDGDLNMLKAVKAIHTSMGTIKSPNLDTFQMTLIVTSNRAKENRLPFKYKYCILQKPTEIPTITREDIGVV